MTAHLGSGTIWTGGNRTDERSVILAGRGSDQLDVCVVHAIRDGVVLLAKPLGRSQGHEGNSGPGVQRQGRDGE